MRRLLTTFVLVLTLAASPVHAAVKARTWLIVLTLARPELQDPKTWSKDEAQATVAHFERLKKLTAERTVMYAGRTTDTTADDKLVPDTMGLIVIAAKDRAAAERIMNDDQAVKAGVLKAKLYSYDPVLQRK